MKLKAGLIFTMLMITVVFSIQTPTTDINADKKTNNQVVATPKNNTNANIRAVSGDKSKTNWSKIKDMFL
jgi:hypothetical protein